MNRAINRYRDSLSDRGRVPSSIEHDSHFELVQRVLAAIEKDLEEKKSDLQTAAPVESSISASTANLKDR